MQCACEGANFKSMKTLLEKLESKFTSHPYHFKPESDCAHCQTADAPKE